MITAKEIKKILRKDRSYQIAEYGVLRIGIFGSYANGTATEKSDIDIVVEFSRPIGFRFIEFIEYLENLLGRKVDVLTPAGIKEIRIESIARSIKESIVYV